MKDVQYVASRNKELNEEIIAAVAALDCMDNADFGLRKDLLLIEIRKKSFASEELWGWLQSVGNILEK
jgi:hypothetical protein